MIILGKHSKLEHIGCASQKAACYLLDVDKVCALFLVSFTHRDQQYCQILDLIAVLDVKPFVLYCLVFPV